jgi:RNA polymerase sigma factor (sigma-70 family)
MTDLQDHVDGAAARTLVARAAGAFAAFQAGDRFAFDTLVEVVTPLMWRTTRGAGLDPTTSEDVIQGVWLALLRSADSVRDPQTIVKWVLTATRREAWRISRRTRTDDRRSVAVFGVDAEEVMDLPAAREPGPEERVIADDRQRVLWGHVQELPERCRQLLSVIAYADKPDYASLAEALGMPVGSIGPTRGRCLAKLRDSLARDTAWAGHGPTSPPTGSPTGEGQTR